MASGIEYKGIPAIIEGYTMHADKLKNLKYALFQGRELKFSYNDANVDEGKNLLLQTLEYLKQSGTSAVYTIRFYDLPKNGKVTSKDEYVSSFTFQVNIPYYEVDRQVGNVQPHNALDANLLMNELKSIREEMNEIRTSKLGDLQPEKTLWDSIRGVIEVPIVEDFIRGVARRMDIPIAEPVYEDNTQARALAGIDTDADKIAMIQDAVQRLMRIDADFHTHLAKLADVAETKPKTYWMAVKML